MADDVMVWVDGRDLPAYREGSLSGEMKEIEQESDPNRCKRITLCRIKLSDAVKLYAGESSMAESDPSKVDAASSILVTRSNLPMKQRLIDLLKALSKAIPPRSGSHHAVVYTNDGTKDKLAVVLRMDWYSRSMLFEDGDLERPADDLVNEVLARMDDPIED